MLVVFLFRPVDFSILMYYIIATLRQGSIDSASSKILVSTLLFWHNKAARTSSGYFDFNCEMMAKHAKLTYLSFNDECSICKHIDFIIVVIFFPLFSEVCYSKIVVMFVTIASRRISFYFWDFRVVVISHILGRK